MSRTNFRGTIEFIAFLNNSNVAENPMKHKKEKKHKRINTTPRKKIIEISDLPVKNYFGFVRFDWL